MIYDDEPKSWRNLEARVLQILLEIGCKAVRAKTVKTVRGTVEVDVYALDDTRQPHQEIIVECKHWNRPVSKSVIHGLRTVVADTGANVGYVVSKRGFQKGAVEAASNSNLLLLDWEGFQEHFFDRWLATVSSHLMFVSDRIYELTANDDDDNFYNQLFYQTQKNMDDSEFEYLDALQTRSVAFSLSSSLIGAAGPTPFITGGQAPDIDTGEQLKFFGSPRKSVDAFFLAAPVLYNEYVDFLLARTNGECGDVRLLESEHLERINSMSKEAIKAEYGSPRWISNWMQPDEKLVYRASKTNFHRPTDAIEEVLLFQADTEEVRLELTFERDGSVKNCEVTKKNFRGLPT
ncbi:restriction endonuclease [Falsihalocynthiibacter sp. CO-5D18]|uniref:restriction endonuclease n=1 Tax=Falsihalocynthiibacter sp. CO-5D18 TaxID=3240872 RepID=UPI00350F86D0